MTFQGSFRDPAISLIENRVQELQEKNQSLQNLIKELEKALNVKNREDELRKQKFKELRFSWIKKNWIKLKCAVGSHSLKAELDVEGFESNPLKSNKKENAFWNSCKVGCEYCGVVVKNYNESLITSFGEWFEVWNAVDKAGEEYLDYRKK